MSLAAIFRRWWSDLKAAHEFAALPPDEREALAHDIGFSSDLIGRILARGSSAGEELTLLLKVVGVEPGEVTPEVMRDLEATCSACEVARQCRRHLRRGAAHVIYRSYCPNAQVIAELENRKLLRDPAYG